MRRPDHYLPGLNSLRFYAAFFVVLAHAHLSTTKLGFTSEGGLSLFSRGGQAVEMFFTLSGFLITYLLMLEVRDTGAVNVRFFYFRRVIRIWPVYFLALALGVIVLKVLVPRLTPDNAFQFPLWPYLLFLPNYASAFYRVGLLYPLWSIGIEEQFYLVWAPLMKLFRRMILPFLIVTALVTVSFATFVHLKFPEGSGEQTQGLSSFLASMKYQNMAIGALFAYVLRFGLAGYERIKLSHPFIQALVIGVILYHYFIGQFGIPEWIVGTLMSFFYGCLFINVSSIAKPLVKLDFQPFIYLGEISYGIYMYHMFVDYGLRYSFGKLHLPLHPTLAAILYTSLLLLLTIAVASLSRITLERYFLSLRKYFSPGKRVRSQTEQPA